MPYTIQLLDFGFQEGVEFIYLEFSLLTGSRVVVKVKDELFVLFVFLLNVFVKDYVVQEVILRVLVGLVRFSQNGGHFLLKFVLKGIKLGIGLKKQMMMIRQIYSRRVRQYTLINHKLFLISLILELSQQIQIFLEIY